jgi:hypothetical protein
VTKRLVLAIVASVILFGTLGCNKDESGASKRGGGPPAKEIEPRTKKGR